MVTVCPSMESWYKKMRKIKIGYGSNSISRGLCEKPWGRVKCPWSEKALNFKVGDKLRRVSEGGLNITLKTNKKSTKIHGDVLY